MPTSLDSLPDGRKKGPQHHKGFAAATAELTGQSKRAINLSVARAEAIGPDILKLSGTSRIDRLKLLPMWCWRCLTTQPTIIANVAAIQIQNRGTKAKRGNKWGNKSHF